MWLRYVDDTFILWPHQEDILTLLDHVNSIRPSIQFPLEKKEDNRSSFLNVLITCIEQGFRSFVYWKPTFTWQYLNFNSHHPCNVKKKIIHILQHQAKAISIVYWGMREMTTLVYKCIISSCLLWRVWNGWWNSRVKRE